jgi:hypothetical protein
VGAVVDHELLGEIRGLVGELLGEEDPSDAVGGKNGSADADSGGHAIRCTVEIRVQSRQVGRTRRYRAVERDFLNSFIARGPGPCRRRCAAG